MVLKDLKDVLPERVAPVVSDMVKQLKRGQEKCCKYEDRSGWEGLIRAKSETVRFRYPHAFSDIHNNNCLLYTSPSPRDRTRSRMPSSA